MKRLLTIIGVLSMLAAAALILLAGLFWAAGLLSPGLAPKAALADSVAEPLAAETYPLSPHDERIVGALNFLRSQQESDGKIAGYAISTWAVMAIAAAGEDARTWSSGGPSIVDYLRDNFHQLNQNLGTDWARAILAIAATKEDPWNFGGRDYVVGLKALYHDGQLGDLTLLNDDVWGILALRAVGEEASSSIIQSSRSYILASQNADGGWSWAKGGSSDADSTAATVMALRQVGEPADSSAIVNALAYLKTQQASDGGLLFFGATNSASDSWGLGALSAAGQDPLSDGWKKDGKSIVGHLLSLREADSGAFRWKPSTQDRREWMTSYAVIALLSNGYPVEPPTPTPTPTPTETPAPGGAAIVSLSPSNVTLDVGETVTIDIRIDNLSGLHGADVRLSYDPAVVQVEDADPWRDGVQVEPGPLFPSDQCFVAANTANNEVGLITYVVVLLHNLHPSPLSGGGVLYTATFRGIAEGDCDLTFARHELVSKGGETLPSSAQDGDIRVGSFGSVQGQVNLQGRSDDSGALVTISGGVYTMTTAADGAFTIADVAAGTYTATATIPGYLYATRSGVVASEDMTTTLSTVTLPGGDTDLDHDIDVTDLVLMGANLGLPVPPADSRADINDDGVVNVFDLVLVGTNYGLAAPIPWP